MKFVMVNFDGVFCVSSHSYYIGVMVHDWRGTFLHAISYGSLADLAFVVECYTAQVALSTTHRLGFNYVILAPQKSSPSFRIKIR